jgi:hypothetical protein
MEFSPVFNAVQGVIKNPKVDIHSTLKKIFY